MAPDRPRRPDPVQDKAAQIARFLRRPIVIIGMMGVGKSTLGPRLGALLKVPFVDTDREIAHAAGCTVAEVFARDGEAKFREVERAVIRRLLRGGLSVIATGGGAPMDPVTARLIFGQSVTVWVRAERDDIVARLAQDTTRPLLQTGEPVGDIVDRILAEREPVYGRADVAVTWRGPSPARMVRDMIAALHRFIQR
jgi:shikimate kinase